MANPSMNNWLGFSLSPQQNSVSHFNSDDQISGTDVSTAPAAECFDLSSHDSSLPSLNLPPPFGILEAFNRNNAHPSQDWKSSSEMSMLMGSSCSGQNLGSSDQGPKFENFLGVGNGGGGGGDYMYSSHSSLQLQPEAAAVDGGGCRGRTHDNNNSTVGLSMIKNWLRNNPTPPLQPENKSNNNNNEYGGGGDAVVGTNGVTLTSAQTLSLLMSTGSQSSPLLTSGGGGDGEGSSSENKRQMETISLDSQVAAGAVEAVVPRKSIDTFGQRTSIYRGVTRHRWTGRYEAHLWDNSCRREGQTRKGRQVYLGGYDKEDKAARAYDLAALKYWGTTTTTNFPKQYGHFIEPGSVKKKVEGNFLVGMFLITGNLSIYGCGKISNYEKEIEEMKHMTRQEYVASLRRKSSGFSRGASIYRGVTRHHQHGRWQARIGRVAGNKDLYLGTFSTQEEAAEAYDIAAIKFRGLNAVTNFEINRYDVKSILESSTLPIGGAAKRLKEAERAAAEMRADDDNMSSHLSHAGINSYGVHQNWPTIAYHQAQPFSMHYPYGSSHQQRLWCKQEVQDADIGTTQSFKDLNQLQLGNVNTHNFFQPSVLHNLMNLDSSSMEHSSGSNSVIYGSGDGGTGNAAAYQGFGGYVMPIGSILAQEENQSQGGNEFGENEVKALGYDHNNPYGSTDPYGTLNLYYQSSGSMAKASTIYDQGSACNKWVPTAVPSTTLTPRATNMPVCHGIPTFTVWNDT